MDTQITEYIVLFLVAPPRAMWVSPEVSTWRFSARSLYGIQFFILFQVLVQEPAQTMTLALQQLANTSGTLDLWSPRMHESNRTRNTSKDVCVTS